MRRFNPFILSTVSLAAMAATPAFAATQPVPPPPPPGQSTPGCPVGTTDPNCATPVAGEPANTHDQNAIVVTGSRIQRPNLESPVPITSITQDELTNQGQVSVGDALNDLPALRSTFSQQNSGRFIGTAGQNFLDLRGLGTNRTLVLVNGRRFINGSPGSFDVDVANIPQDLIDRIDIVTGGESAVYGSDAVAGVVNFILKQDFEGFKIKAQGGESTHGDRPVDFVTVTYGKNFADGRGNLAANVEYTHAGELFFRDRKHFSNVCGFEPNPADNGGANDPRTATGDSTNGIPDRIFVCGIRNPFITNGGNIGLLSGDGTNLSFDPSGNLVITPPADQSFLDFGGTLVSNNPLIGSTLRETGDLAVGTDRYSGTLIGHFDVSDAFKPFIEATAVQLKVHQEGQPSFFQGNLADFFDGDPKSQSPVPDLRCSNAFLTPQNLATLQEVGLCANPATDTFGLNRFNVDMGARKELDIRNTYRVVLGVKGDFNEDWHYEVSFNYGHTHDTNIEKNDLQITDQFGNPTGFGLAVDAVRDANGNIVCRSTLTDPGNGCVPIDLFGEGQPSQAALNYVNRTSHLFASATQMDLLAFMSGDSSQLFSLPGGPIGFSIGTEYRRETANQHADAVSAAGGTFFNAFSPFTPPAFKVFEFFGELNVPILKDLPFVHELTASGAARESHYSTSAGHTFAWNANLVYSPVRDLRLRANYSKSVRVPTLGDLFSPASVNFGFVADPCDQRNINVGNRPENCAALGVPTTVTSTASPCFSTTLQPQTGPVGSPFHNCIAANRTIEFESSGNPFLTAETGKSLTLGGVFTPRFIPGFSLSVDYFRINVTNLISVLGAQTILNQCVDSTSINNQFCQLIFPRDQFGLLASPALISAGVNFAREISRGIDFDLSYRHRFANGMRLSLRGIATRTLERTDFTSPTDPNLGNRILSEVGDPAFSGTMIAGVGMGKFDLKYTLRYIGSMSITAFENLHPFPEGCLSATRCPPFNSDIEANANTGAILYHDVRLDYNINKYNFYVGVDNLFNKAPPLGQSGTELGISNNGGPGIFDNFGRFVYAGAVLNLK
jgi:outer membrane receptor protein involved in Fe transport